MLYSFSPMSFYLKISHTRFLMRQHVQFNLRMLCTLFFENHFFPLGFRMEFLTRHVHILVIAQGGMLKNIWTILEGKEKDES